MVNDGTSPKFEADEVQGGIRGHFYEILVSLQSRYEFGLEFGKMVN